MKIYHIVLPSDKASAAAEYYSAASLAGEGFIHCSYEHQIDAVLARYYAGAASVFVLEIDTDLLESRLVEEPSTAGEIYPHIYGPINRGAVVSITERQVTAR